jgi:putative transposase
MRAVVMAVVKSLAWVVRSRMVLQIEILALRHQLAVYQRSGRRPRLRPADRLLWAWLSRNWSRWRQVLVIVQPRTVISWQRKRFRDYWTRLSRAGQPGHPALAKEIRDLIRKISAANPTWGSPRIRGELGKLGIDVAKSTVEKYRVRPSKPSSPTWRTFLATHAKDLVAIDFFTVATIRFEILFVLVYLSAGARDIVHSSIRSQVA